MRDRPAVRDSWLIGLDAWVIQDGNYPDVVTGQRADFALEFASRRGLSVVDEAPSPRVAWVAGSRYEVTAQIVHDEPHAQVIDFGLRAYRFVGIEDPAHRSQVGAWVTGEVDLAVDPFFYKDELAKQDGFPALSYSWTVQEVLERLGGDRLVTIAKTDAWGDVSTSPSYVLRCVSAEPELVGRRPRPGPGPRPR